MNCDQVFDVLTRGPFPTGDPCDASVEAHLNECAECRRLAEALRPALELFQEAVDPEESRDLPGYWCAASDAQRASVSYAPELESPKRLSRVGVSGVLASRPTARIAWRMAAMLMLGVSLGMLASARWLLDGSMWSGFGSDASVAPLAPRKEQPRLAIAERMKLAALPAACFGGKPSDDSPGGHRGNPLLADVALADLSCCSGCHNAGSDAVPRGATAEVAQSCQLCHVGNP